jgi:segregation and condensation protein A
MTEAQPNIAEKTAVVRGQTLSEMPKDLYIPPDALEVFLEAFEGPLDLLLYLIRKQNLEILDIPIAEITRQYMQYIELMHYLKLELAGEYLVMAAMLAEIKSRMLLPRPVESNENEDDPRAELIRRLQEYERFKKAAEDLNTLPRMERDIFPVEINWECPASIKPLANIELKELITVLNEVLARAKLHSRHQVQLEGLSIRERMVEVLNRLKPDQFVLFHELFTIEEGRIGVVVTFIAILELLKQSVIEMVQSQPFASIHVKAVT